TMPGGWPPRSAAAWISAAESLIAAEALHQERVMAAVTVGADRRHDLRQAPGLLEARQDVGRVGPAGDQDEAAPGAGFEAGGQLEMVAGDAVGIPFHGVERVWADVI